MNKLSAIILAQNEEQNIERCLRSLAFCDEVILIDDSNDKTVDIARRIRPKDILHVVKDRENNNFADVRNKAMKLAKHEWVLFVDADEEVPELLQTEIAKNIAHTPMVGFYLKRKDYFLGTWLNWGETGCIGHLKLGRKNAGTWLRKVHEVWNIDGAVGELQTPLLHFPHQTIAEFLSHINRWTTLDAQVFYESGGNSGFWKIIVYPLGKFVRNYFVKLGFLDGMPGLIMVLMMSFHSFLTRAKLYLMHQ